ncbi:hypothetical protein V0288_13530 [Pannus brasiliensis CCIBt3594]|uniref:Uncharacterized protein n=1 Tax=Pannus brasiliensis CCIBt3594 TaxID=1427578 RepID=A0AAW9QYF9_9CHRO
MEKTVTDEQRVSELMDNCQRAVHDSLEDIRQALSLLENSIETGKGRETLSRNLETVQNILGEVCQEFQDLDRQMQFLAGDRSPAKVHPNLTEKLNFKPIELNWSGKNSLDKTA